MPSETGSLSRGRTAVYLLGAPGVGKTSIWRQQSHILHDLGVKDYVVIDGELFYEAHWGHQVQLAERRHESHLDLAEEMRRWKMETLQNAMDEGFNIVPWVTSWDFESFIRPQIELMVRIFLHDPSN